MSTEPRLRLAHMVADGDTSGLFRGMARRHDRQGYDLEFLTLRAPEPAFRAALEAIEVPVHSAGASGRATWPRAVLRLVHLLRKRRIQILHTHIFEPSLVGLTAGAVARVPLRVMTRHHSDYHTRLDARLPTLLDRLCTRLAHGVVAVSKHTRDVMVQREGAPPGKVRVVPNGLDPERVRRPPPDEVERLRQELRRDGLPVLLVPARLHPEKGHDHLFQALSELRDDGRRVLTYLAGSGSYRNSYERRVQELGLDGDVVFLGHRSDVIALMAAADLVVLPSVAEAFGLVALEARAVGAPLVATKAGGLAEVVRDGVDGVLVSPSDPSALAAAVDSVLGDDGLRRRMSRPDPSVAERFSFDRMIREYEAYYQELWNAR